MRTGTSTNYSTSHKTCDYQSMRLALPGASLVAPSPICGLHKVGFDRVQLLLGHSKIGSTVRYLGIEVDDALEMAEQIARRPQARELLARLRKFRGRLPADFKFDRVEANGRG
jgi:hypothetical protein